MNTGAGHQGARNVDPGQVETVQSAPSSETRHLAENRLRAAATLVTDPGKHEGGRWWAAAGMAAADHEGGAGTGRSSGAMKRVN